VAAAALLGHLHQPHDVGQQRALADGQDLQAQRRLDVQRAGEDAVARADGGRQGLAGDEARVDLRRDEPAPPGRRRRCARPRRPGPSCRAGPARRAGRPPSLAVEHGDRGDAQRQQALGGRAGAAAGEAVEVAADQEEEEQGDRAVEVGVGPPRIVSDRLIAVARTTPTEIGTSMLARPARSAPSAERKKGRPA
jgi:hypothetical protein